MYNDFVLVGPSDDPARIKGLPKATEALTRIAQGQARFVSRGDKSGTHVLEQTLWKAAGIEPRGAWYIESGQGMRTALAILVEKDRSLLNIYSVMEVNPANGSRVNVAAGKAFADFMVAPKEVGG